MKSVVIYKSKSGFVKKYAQWIADRLSCDLYEASSITADELKNYDTIIFGGGLYAVGINGIKIIKQNLEQLKHKNLVVFASGASPGRKENIDEVINGNFTKEQLNYIKFFYMRGGFDYSKLKISDRFLMILLKLKLKIKKNHTPDERGMLAAYEHPADFTREQNIEELVEYVKSLEE